MRLSFVFIKSDFSAATSLYLTLWSDLDKTETVSKDFTHHHLMTILKMSLEDIKRARESLEAMGLLRTYYKEGDIISERALLEAEKSSENIIAKSDIVKLLVKV